MTEPAKTIMFHPPEWQSVCIGSVQQLAGFISQRPVLTDDELKAVEDHIDRLKTFARAWKASVPPKPVELPAAGPQEQAQPAKAGAPNGVGPHEKRKYTRRSRAEAQATQ